MEDWQALAVADALHTPEQAVVDMGDGMVHEITETTKRGVRRVSINGIVWQMQNPSKSSRYAAMAKAGSKITWIMTRPRWGMIKDGEIIARCGVLKYSNKAAYEKSLQRHAAAAAASGLTAAVPTTADMMDAKEERRPSKRIRRSAASVSAPASSADAADTRAYPAPTASATRRMTRSATRRLEAMPAPSSVQGRDITATAGAAAVTATALVPTMPPNADAPMLVYPGDGRVSMRSNSSKRSRVRRSDSARSDSSAGAPPPIQFADLHFGKRCGRGGFATVFRGTWRGADVAIKQLSGGVEAAELAGEVQREAALLQRLRHPNIVLFLGTCVHQDTMYLITEFCPAGSVYDAIHTQRRVCDMDCLIRLARDVAHGVQYLHLLTPKIIHRDLKPGNLLLDAAGHVKLCDFGISRESLNTHAITATGAIGTVAYMAPEMIVGRSLSDKVDSYAFGVILWEMLTGKVPFAGETPIQIAVSVSHEQRRLAIPKACPAWLSQLIQACWHHDPTKRPDFGEILQQLPPQASKQDASLQLPLPC